MAIDTKPNLNSCKFEQFSGETLNLSGCTDIFGTFEIVCGAILSILPSAGNGKVLTSDNYGNATWQNTIAGIVNACNGLTTDGTTVCLGGTLITGTTILNSSYTFLISGATNSSVCSVIQSPYYYPFSIVEQTIISQTSNDILLQACHNTQGRVGGIFISTITGNTNVMHLFAAGGDSGTASGDIVLEGTSFGVTISGMCTNFHTPIKIYSTPTGGTTSDKLLVWDSGDKLVKQIAISAITSGGTGGVTGATNLGSGNGTIYTSTINNNLQLKTLSGGTNITLTCNGNYISINSTAAAGGIGWSNLTNGSTVAGCGTMASGSTTCNTFYGVCVGYGLTTGSGNTAMGSHTAKLLTCGKNNVAIGYQAFCGNIRGCNSVAIGFQANALSGCGCDNVAVGYQSLYGNNYGERNIAIGSQALFCNNCGSNNVAFGACALCCNASGGYNFAMGYQSMPNNVTGTGNIAIGYLSLYGSVCGDCNIGLGYYTLGGNICGCDNIALGWAALGNNNCGKWNIGFGCRAAIGNTKGCHNIAIGCEALNSNSTGTGNIAIGRGAGYSETGSYKLYIASGATSPLIYGDFTLQCVDICNNLNVNGAVKIKTVDDGTCSNSVLTWDAGTCCVKKVPYISGSTSGTVKICSFLITGNSSNVGFVVNHSLSNQFVIVQVVQAASPYATVYTDVQRVNTNSICVCFDTAPPSGTNYCIVVTG
jgi:hypothetical protein